MQRTACLALWIVALCAGAVLRSQSAESVPLFHRIYDQIIDLNVRDGMVYYRALRSERARLDRYVASLNVPAATYQGWSRDEKVAFWLNGYNAIVLQTVINNYPIRGKSSQFPQNSIRQVSGAFEGAKHRLAGKSLTLDEIEKTVLPEFGDPRVYLALGRGAVGSGRLRSEAYTGPKLREQLGTVQSEFVSEQAMLRIDKLTGKVTVTPIISWREAEFVKAYDKGAEGPYAQRSPIERAVLAFISPHLLRIEKEFVEKNAFELSFHTLDWRLNDLTGGRID
jgi:Protein of unknown function, DUF547